MELLQRESCARNLVAPRCHSARRAILDSDHMIKLLALGASAINVAALLQAAMPVAETPRYESKLTDSLLGSLRAPRKLFAICRK